MKTQIVILAAAISMSVCASASADDFDSRWNAALDGEQACLVYSHVDRDKLATNDPYATMCAAIHRLFETMRPAAEQRYRDAERREVTRRLGNDLHAAQR